MHGIVFFRYQPSQKVKIYRFTGQYAGVASVTTLNSFITLNFNFTMYVAIATMHWHITVEILRTDGTIRMHISMESSMHGTIGTKVTIRTNKTGYHRN